MEIALEKICNGLLYVRGAGIRAVFFQACIIQNHRLLINSSVEFKRAYNLMLSGL